ncbi:MAG: hypothetical protein JXQ23_10110 [Clostridia bacterium]|nr:hypothetical protein [Clostridia bacterium]
MGYELRRWFDIYEYYELLESLSSPYATVSNLTPSKRLPIFSIHLTDHTVDDSKKQNVLITAMHAGVEYSGSNTVISLMKWLLEESEEAKCHFRHFNIFLIPIPNPYIYEKGDITLQHKSELSNDPYFEPWTLNGVTHKELNWEAAAIQEFIDRHVPDLLIDCHGVFFKGQNMIENTGISVNGLSRPHNMEFTRILNEAAGKNGYHVDDLDLRQKILSVDKSLAGRKYSTCAYGINPCVYAYHNYHTLSSVMEIGNEKSGLIRLKKALELGLRHWDGEKNLGYPVNRLFGEGFYSFHPLSDSYTLMREERTDIWNETDNISMATVHPQFPGNEGFLLLDDNLHESVRYEISYGLDVRTFSEYLKDPVLKEYMVRRFENRYMSFNLAKNPKMYSKPFTIGIRIPFRNACILGVNINGKSVGIDSYVHRQYDWFSIVFVNFRNGFSSTTLVDIQYMAKTDDKISD